ncbi:hypothetical protein BOTBODRAFT_100535 [Botryobasidium botryosum FD-172 SS1]|uniref:Nudix hydrolase domain-containing protein n=1 Tax=Botryobasidium botryosum (strain FD-172 SS1) TaxID=930990 RepID=A0A067MZ48_BOTB1|nr:hypothetical protein BOTBODRAFT_100535 [Botryobasidium botryosum FD-172 SS1]
MASNSKSLLPVLEKCDNFRIQTCPEQLIPFFLNPPIEGKIKSTLPIGMLRPLTVVALQQYLAVEGKSTPWKLTSTFFSFAAHVTRREERTAAMKDICETWHVTNVFSDVIGGRLWRDELYTVYRDPFLSLDDDNIAFAMERVCCALFGIVTYGVHMSMYTPTMKMWIPKRAATKQTWPGYLDNTVAGGIPHGLSPLEAIIKECMEEASLPEDFVRSRIKAAGAITYFFQTSKGWLQPEVQYIYDLCADEKVTPAPSDGEVDSFELSDLDSVLQSMHKGAFKPNCALVLLDFFIRHGYITPENEPNFLEILTRLHGRFGYKN